MLMLVINPTAGNGLADKIGTQADELLTQKGVEHQTARTQHAGHATELAKEAAAQGADTVIAVGGDGTAFEVARGLIGTRTGLGILPAGTGNDLIKTLGTPRKWQEALEFILTHPKRPMDIGGVNDGIFLNECGTGFDVMILDYAEKAKRFVRGLLPYLYGLIRAIFSFKPLKMKLTLDDGTVIDGKYLVCAIANGRYIGGGIPIAPEAQLGDGMLDVEVLEAVPRHRIPKYVPGLLSGKILQFDITHHYRCRSCTLECESMRLNMDGEIFAMDKAEFTLRAEALLVHW